MMYSYQFDLGIECVNNWITMTGIPVTVERSTITTDDMNRPVRNYSELDDEFLIIPIPTGMDRNVTDGGELNNRLLKILTNSKLQEDDLVTFNSVKYLVKRVEAQGREDERVYQCYMEEYRG